MSEQPQVSIDLLAPQRSHIDLTDKSLPTDFGIEDYVLNKLFDDVVLVEYCDIHGDDKVEYIMRGGIAVPINNVTNAWRKGKVVLKGPRATQVELGEIIMCPNNMGIPISNVEVKNYGKVKKGLFINQERMFGGCELKENNE